MVYAACSWGGPRAHRPDLRNACTQRGSNWVPPQREISWRAWATSRPAIRPVAVIASSVSGDGEDARPRGIASPRRRLGYPAPSQPPVGEDDLGGRSEEGMASRIPYPTSGCRRISAHSALVSGPGLSRCCRHADLAMSCRRARGRCPRSDRPRRPCAGPWRRVADHPLGMVAGLVLARVQRVHQRRQRVRVGLRHRSIAALSSAVRSRTRRARPW